MNLAGNKGALLAVKVAGTGAVIGVSEALWKKKNRAAAILFMISFQYILLFIELRFHSSVSGFRTRKHNPADVCGDRWGALAFDPARTGRARR